MSQKRVAVVLASLVGTMTVSAAALLIMEGGALGTNIPGAYLADTSALSTLTPSVPLQAQAWSYIIIYESGDAAGSAAALADGLLSGDNANPAKAVRPQANFHFVVQNADDGNGTVDGALKVGTSWKSQVPGAPYAGWPDSRSYSYTPYNNAVGVCFIGNLNRKPLSQAQHQSLLQTVRQLQRQLNIPSDRVLFHWDSRLGVRQVTPAELAYDRRFHDELD